MSDQEILESIVSKLRNTVVTKENFPTPDVLFYDIQSLLANANHIQHIAQGLGILLPRKGHSPSFDCVLAFDARGFLFGNIIALTEQVPLVMARKKGKLPPPTIHETYQKEYGPDTLEIEEGIIQPGMRVLIHDDLLATGGTSEAAAKLILRCGGEIAGFNYVMELDELNGREKLREYASADKIRSLLHV